MPTFPLKHAARLTTAALAATLWAASPAQASRVATNDDSIGSGLSTVADRPGLCSAGGVSGHDLCAGFMYSGATLAGAQALATTQGWGPGTWSQSTDTNGAHSYTTGAGTSTATLFDADFGPVAPNWDKAWVGKMTFTTELAGNFVIAMSGIWTDCLLHDINNDCVGFRTQRDFTAYYLYDDVILRAGGLQHLDLFLRERVSGQQITSLTLYEYQALPNQVPEPTSLGLVAVALLGLVSTGRRRVATLLARG